jgi:RNA polymerase sigma-70 factor, ECF subfamily
MKTKKSSQPADLYIDEATLQLLAARDRVFLTSLFSEVNPYLARVCAASGVHNEHLDEVIHDTWERFFTNLDKFEGRSQIRTFICGILFNKIREYRRGLGKTVFEEDSEKVMNNAFTLDGWWNLKPHNPHKLAELKEASDFIQDCLEGLSDQQKTAFVMKEVGEEKAEDICNTMQINISHLRVLIFRAKDKLRKCLEGKMTPENNS